MEYLRFLTVVATSFILIRLLFLVVYFGIPKKYDTEKITAYECGFETFENSRNKFEVHFYLVSILFIIFDLEVMFLFPWCASLTNASSTTSYTTVIAFLLILTIGFVYEWSSGALNWNVSSLK